jgi:hypothetical protein
LPTTGSGLSATGSTTSEGSFKPKRRQGTIENEEEFPTLVGEAATTKKV